MLCKECSTCFWFNPNETQKSVSECDDNSQVCIPIDKSQVLAIAKELSYIRNIKSDNIHKPSVLDISQALSEIYGKRRKAISSKSIERVLKRLATNT